MTPSPAELIARVKQAQTVAQARRDVNTSPTPAQAEAGNYRVGRCVLHGIPISLENPRGSIRRGVDPNGKEWSSKMTQDYGYFTGTTAVDGDSIDVFIGPDHKSELVFAVDQVDSDGDFDETKFMMGFSSRDEAVKGYLSNYPKGWKLGTVTSCTVEQLKEWLKDGKHKASFGGQMLKAAFDANPLYDWDGTLIRRVPGNAKAYFEALKGFTPADRGPAADMAHGPLDLVTARPKMFHPAIMDAAGRLGLDVRSIRHAKGDKVDAVRELDRPLMDDDPAILAAISEALGSNYALKLPEQQKAAHSATKGCLMLQLPERIRERIRAFKNEHIPAGDIVDDEDDFHTTILYGFKPEVKARDVLEYLSEGGMNVGLGVLKIFPASAKRPESDALVVAAYGWKTGDGDNELSDLNAELAKAFGVKSDWKYQPHVTLAYVKPGSMDKLVEEGGAGGKAPFDDEEYNCTEMVFSTGPEDARDKTRILLTSAGDDRRKDLGHRLLEYCGECDTLSSCRCRTKKDHIELTQCHACKNPDLDLPWRKKKAASNPDRWERLCERRGQCPTCRSREYEGYQNGQPAPEYGGCTCADKSAAQMVKKKRIVEETDDHCPHCDHKFQEKGYPRPNRIEGESHEDFRARIDAGDYDEICPNCQGIVDPVEETDEEIERYAAWGIVDAMKEKREKRRQRIAARADKEYKCEHGINVPFNTCDYGCKSTEKKVSGRDFQKALNESDVPGDMTFFTDGADRCTIAYGDWHEEEECEKGRALAKKFFSDYEEADATEIGRPSWAVQSLHASRPKSASAAPPTYDFPTTGPEAIMHLLKNTSLDELDAEARADIASRKKTKRPRAVKILNLVEGLRRNDLSPQDMMIRKVPVIQPGFRPFNVMGDTLMVGDANELYKDLIDHKDAYTKVRNTLGEASAKAEFRAMQQAVRAVHGYADSPNPKTVARGVSGFLQKVTGVNGPKTSYVHRRLLSKTQDGVGRGVIIPNPDLDMDQIGIPADAAWRMYGDYVQRNLVRSGMSPLDALKHTKDRSSIAMMALEKEFGRRPVIYSRSPAWHQFNIVAGIPRIVDGDSIQISPWVTAGHGADFDGDSVDLETPIVLRYRGQVMLMTGRELEAQISTCTGNELIVAEGFEAWTYSGWSRVANFSFHTCVGKKKYRVTLKNGVSFIVSEDHSIMVDRKEVKPAALTVGTSLDVSPLQAAAGDGGSYDEGVVYGHFMGDGCAEIRTTGNARISIACKPDVEREYLKSLWRTHFDAKITDCGHGWFQLSDQKHARDFLRLCGRYCYGKLIHPELLSKSPDFLKGMLAGYILSDGSVETTRSGSYLVRTWSRSKRLRDAMALVASMLGLPHSIRERVAKGETNYIISFGKDAIRLLDYRCPGTKGERILRAVSDYATIRKDARASQSVRGNEVISVAEVTYSDRMIDLEVESGEHVFSIIGGVVLHNTMNIHVPADDDSIRDSYDKLLPSKMLWSNKDPDKVVPVPKHEQVLQIYKSSVTPGARHRFATEAEALKAIHEGTVKLEDDIDIGPPENALPSAPVA